MFSFANINAGHSEEFTLRLWTLWDTLPDIIKDDAGYLAQQVDNKKSGLCKTFDVLMKKSDSNFIKALCGYMHNTRRNGEATYVNNCVSLDEFVTSKNCSADSEGQPLEERIPADPDCKMYLTPMQNFSFEQELAELSELREYIMVIERVDIFYLISAASEKTVTAISKKSADILSNLVVKYKFADLLKSVMQYSFAVVRIKDLADTRKLHPDN